MYSISNYHIIITQMYVNMLYMEHMATGCIFLSVMIDT